MGKQTETCSKKVRGRAQRSLDLIEAMYTAAEEAQPITGRGIGYKLFTAGLIPFAAEVPTSAMSYAMVTGICGRCAERDDAALQNAVLKALRNMYPDVTLSAVGRA